MYFLINGGITYKDKRLSKTTMIQQLVFFNLRVVRNGHDWVVSKYYIRPFTETNLLSCYELKTYFKWYQQDAWCNSIATATLRVDFTVCQIFNKKVV